MSVGLTVLVSMITEPGASGPHSSPATATDAAANGNERTTCFVRAAIPARLATSVTPGRPISATTLPAWPGLAS